MRYLLLFFILMLLAGCGYHMAGEDDCAVLAENDVMIEIFANRTTEPFLEDYLSNAIIDVVSASSHINAVSAEAKMHLEGEVLSYSTAALSYNQNDVISEYRLTLRIKARLVRVEDGKYLWRGDLEQSTEFPADSDRTRQQDSERQAAKNAAKRLAEDLRSELCLMAGEL
jgi:outer membrane lipopolysaccharide assembly protein LptE/RlpB